MKAFSKRGSAVPGAPGEKYAPEMPWAVAGPAVREPAPAGALQRARAGGYSDIEEEVDERPYVPVRGKLRFRFRGVIRSTVGRVLLGSVAFVGLCVVVGGALVTRNYLLHDPRFVIPSSDQIETVGNVHLTREQLLSVFGADVERNIFKVPLAERRADLERLPWVQRATVMRLLPNTLRVQVVERTPVAFVRQGSAIGLVDASGVLLDMPASDAGDPHYSFPVLTGLAASDPLSMRAARMEIYRRFMKDLDSSGEKVTDNLSEVDVSSPEDVKALIPSGSTDILVHFGDEDFLQRYRHFEEHLPEWKQQYPKFASADMRYDRQVVLEMAPGTNVPENVASNSETPALPAAKADERAPETVVKKPVKTEAAPAAKAPVRGTHAAARPVSVAGGKTSAANARMFAALAAARRQETSGSGAGPQ
ncbi:MAG TPA: FtsQ-type POTRA domain-containing protein [Acidobacteriaceae bacterium]|nr:FtsQ-type POTRA domain-containing protein [Acidobacteriaceae bacterium]